MVSYPDEGFRERLGTAGFAVEEISVTPDAVGEHMPDIIWPASKRA